MQSIDSDNLHKIIDECRGFLRADIIEAMEAASAEISRLQEVVKRLQREKRTLRAAR